MKKRILLLILPLLAGGGQAVGAVSDGSETNPIDPVETGVSFEADGIYYKIIDETKLFLSTVEGPVKYSGKVVIPDEVKYDGKDWKVTKVSGFLNCPDVTEITIPRYVMTISGFYGSYGYWDSKSGIKSPRLKVEGEAESKLRTVHFNAENCEKAYYKYHKTGMMGGGTYGEQAAFPSTVVNVDFGENVTKVPVGLFVYCSGIKEVVFPESVTEIGALFIDKDYDNVEKCEILSLDLQVCDWLPNNYSAVTLGPEFHTYPYSDSGVRYGAEHVGLYTPLTDKPYVFHKYMGFDPETATRLELPSWVRKIAPRAFITCESLTELSLDGLEEIGDYAFNGTQFEELEITSSTPLVLGEEAVWATKLVFNVPDLTLNGLLRATDVELNCDRLKFEYGSLLYARRCVYNVAYVPEDLEAVLFDRSLTEAVIGEKVKIIPTSVFLRACLKYISIPANVQEIEALAFTSNQEAGTLEEVYLDANLIPQEGKFVYHSFPSSLRKLTIGPNCHYIPPSMFEFCTGLTELEIPSTVESLGDDAFGVSGLRSVKADSKEFNFSAFESCYDLSEIILGDNVEAVAGIMYGTQVKELYFPRNMKGKARIPTLESVTFGERVTSVPTSFLYECPLKNIVFEGDVEELGFRCFYESKLEKIVLPESLKKYDHSYGLSEVTELEINSEDCDFYDNPYSVSAPKLKKVTIGEKVRYNLPFHFSGFEGAKLYFNARRMERLNKLTFFNSTQDVFSEVIIGENVEYIPEDFMLDNNNLREIVLPRSVKELGYCAFRGCEGILRVVSAPFTPPVITNYEYYKDENFAEIVYATATLCVPVGCAESYRNAEGWKNFKNIVELESLGHSGVSMLETAPGDGEDPVEGIYTLSGQKVTSASEGGVYILRYRSGRVEKIVAPARL